MSLDHVAVITLTESTDDAVQSTQKSIARELISGRDVVVVCDSRRLRREERLMLARPAIARSRFETCDDGCGKLAIVNVESCSVNQQLPAEISRCVQFFATLDSAMNWLRPIVAGPLSGTQHYFTLPTCQAG